MKQLVKIVSIVVILCFVYALPAVDGQERKVAFSNYNWTAKQDVNRIGPGFNYFSDSKKNVKINLWGNLKLSINKKGAYYRCAEIYTDTLFGYGKFVFIVNSAPNSVSKNCVLGLFLYDATAPPLHNELDIEFSQWGLKDIPNSQFVVYTNSTTPPLHQFNTPFRWATTHTIDRYRDSVVFKSYEGKIKRGFDSQKPYQQWSYTLPQNKTASFKQRVHLNYWILENKIPNKRKSNFRISDFFFIPE